MSTSEGAGELGVNPMTSRPKCRDDTTGDSKLADDTILGCLVCAMLATRAEREEGGCDAERRREDKDPKNVLTVSWVSGVSLRPSSEGNNPR